MAAIYIFGFGFFFIAICPKCNMRLSIVRCDGRNATTNKMEYSKTKTLGAQTDSTVTESQLTGAALAMCLCGRLPGGEADATKFLSRCEAPKTN